MGCKQSVPKGSVVLQDDNHYKNNKEFGAIKTSKSNLTSITSVSSAPVSESALHLNSSVLNLPPEIQKLSDPGQQLYHILKDASILSKLDQDSYLWTKVIKLSELHPKAARYQHPQTLLTPLHLACIAISAASKSTSSSDDNSQSLCSSPDAVRALIKAYPEALAVEDARGCIPLHYAVCPNCYNLGNREDITLIDSYFHRAEIVKILVASDYDESMNYLTRNDVKLIGTEELCTPIYLAIASIPDDFYGHGPTTYFIRALHEAHSSMITARNKTNHDNPLSLLYRRFSRQFDFSEKFFPGDNSRLEVLNHRNKYKAAAVNTWKIIQTVMRPTPPVGQSTDTLDTRDKSVTNNTTSNYQMVHAAVQMDCPPDLLRYIIETRSNEVKKKDISGRLPIHCAATISGDKNPRFHSSFPAYHSKFVIDELLYSYPDGVAVEDRDGKLPLKLAIESDKTWIGGGIRSLYQIYPDAMKTIEIEKYPNLNSVMSVASGFEIENNKDDDVDDVQGSSCIHKEENYDAIMLVQKNKVELSDVVSVMWANEEDGGVQMLGCMAISRLVKSRLAQPGDNEIAKVLPIAIPSVSAIVNAMKNHPNEPAIQEKACSTLLALSPADTQLETSFAASGALASIVAAMQAHVSDAIVQEVACAALRNIVKVGGAERATVLGSVSGFTAIQNAMGAHPNEVRVQKEACQALLELTAFSADANLPDLPGGQLQPLLEAAAVRYPAECKECACQILLRLS